MRLFVFLHQGALFLATFEAKGDSIHSKVIIGLLSPPINSVQNYCIA
jgi:hypothetical protein